MKTKKFPVCISYKDFSIKSEEFIIPFTGKDKFGFRGLKSGNVSKYGMITYIGMEITHNDVFAKLVESGQKINSVDITLDMLNHYLEELQNFKIGNVISVVYDSMGNFELIKEANRP